MSKIIALEKDAMDITKCAYCDNYLSIPPIIAISADGKEYKCGRCHDVTSSTIIRNYCFENVAQFLTFPCTYNGCEEIIKWGNVEEHEKICRYKMISCPVGYDCVEMVKVSQLKAHFQSKHEVYFQKIVCNLKTSSAVTNAVSSSTVLLLIVNGQYYIVYIFLWSTLSFVSVFSIAPLKVPRKYNVTMTSSNSSVLYRNQDIVFYNERQHCRNCLRKTCTKKYHPHSRNQRGIDFSKISTMLKYPSIMELLERPESVTFEISLEPDDSKTEQLPEEEEPLVPLESKQLTIRQTDLLCPICQNYMVAPIYTCKTGHAICKACKTVLTKCPSCRADIGDARCFSLETIAENIEVPCAYKDEGCTFVGKIGQVICHQEICTFWEKVPAINFIQHLWK